MTTKVSILIPTREQFETLDSCLSALHDACAYPFHSSLQNLVYECFLLDGSTNKEETIAVAQKYKYPLIMRHVPVDGWWNFSQILNHGAKLASGEYLLHLNNDCYLPEDFFQKLCTRLNPSRIQGFLLTHLNNTIQHAGVTLFRGQPQHIGYLAPKDWFKPPVDAFPVPAVTFACVLVPRAVHDALQGLDEDFSFCYEDVDFCLRAWEKNYHTHVRYDVTAIHESHKSGKTMSLSPANYVDKNMVLFSRKWPHTRLLEVLSMVNRMVEVVQSPSEWPRPPRLADHQSEHYDQERVLDYGN
jgi:Glycosyltransferase like family 2